MAVIKCKECGGQVAKSAKACPHCGSKQTKQVGVIGWLFVLLIVLPIAWGIGGGMADVDKAVQSKPAATAKTESDKDNAPPAWVAAERIDSMTDETVKSVSLRSTNSTLFERPYAVRGGSYLYLTFRNNAGDIDAYFAVDKGQMLCSSSSCKFSIRVGDNPVQQWTGLPSSTHNSDMMFVRDAEQLMNIISSGAPIRIGIEFFRAGSRTFEFEPAGFPGV